jgi:hypothetical protein
MIASEMKKCRFGGNTSFHYVVFSARVVVLCEHWMMDTKKTTFSPNIIYSFDQYVH